MNLTEEDIRKLKELASNADSLISILSSAKDNKKPEEDAFQEVAKKLIEHKDELNGFIDKLIWFERSGTFETILGVAALIKIIQDSLSDEVVAKNSELLTNIGLIAAKFSNENSLRLFSAIGDSICRCSGKPEPVGLVSLIKALREPEVQKTIGMLISIAREMGKNIP